MNFVARISSLCLAVILLCNSATQAQITKLQDYTNRNSAPIGSYQGVNFREAGFSGLYPIPNTNGKEFWTISDRGPNIDCGNANPVTCRPTYDKLFPFPSYAPKIHRIRINGDSIQILRTITMKRPGGTTATGLMNPTGFGSTATEVITTDTVLDCANFSLKTAAKDVWGLDSEGMVVDKDGNFWICDEGGACIWKLNANGIVMKRYTPYANLPGAQPEDVQIDTVFKYRKNNRGFEGIAIAPNGKIYAIIQSPILYPTQSVGEGTRIHRILEIDPSTNAMRMLVYLNDGIIGSSGSNQIRMRDWKIGDMAAINDSTFLVLEAAARGTSDIKRLYMININRATAVHSGLYTSGSKTLEALIDSAGLAANAITPVRKTLVMDLLANGWTPAYDKAEGLAIINDSTIAICNDNDFGASSPASDGLASATGLESHLVVYKLSGVNKLAYYKAPVISINQGASGISSSQAPYLTPATPELKFTSIITVSDTADGYKMVGIPDGLGAFDNNDGTFTLLMNHELSSSVGAVRAHGSIGAFVSKWIINKTDLRVVSGSDLMKNVKLWNGSSYTTYNLANPSTLASFSRFCSADLPEKNAFYYWANGMGTTERIFMNGEESGLEGRAIAHIVTGPNAGTSYELPWLGKMAWENAVARPYASSMTVVAALDDGSGGQVYMYIGTKSNTGTEIDKAGLTNGKLYGIAVSGLTTEGMAIPADNTPFSLVDMGTVYNITGDSLNKLSIAKGVTSFLRPEDGAWDPSNLRDFYFNTTNSFSAPSRVWRLRFTNPDQPELGGTITAVLDGTEGQKMLDNMAIDNYGHIMLQEDVGNNAHNGKIWQYTIATDKLELLAQHDSTRFIAGGANYLTQDEESSGIIDVQNILGAGMFLTVDQAHYPIAGEAVEGGQLLTMFNPTTFSSAQGRASSSSQTPYITPIANGVKCTAVLTTPDSVGNYKMAGIPDGLGAFDNNDGSFTLLMNHELTSGVGAVRAHGSNGAFVSKWIINKSDLRVLSGSDLMKNVNLWNGNSYSTYNSSKPSALAAFSRFCAADLPAPTAFYFASTGLGTQERIYMNGEESGTEGRAMAHIVTGANAGTSYELPWLGKLAWENAVASPYPSNKTIVVGLDDGTGGQVYVYVGNKTNSGNEIERAGLTNGKLYGISVTGVLTEGSTAPPDNSPFILIDLGNVAGISGDSLNKLSIIKGITSFLRPEDGAWDPSNPRDFYFNTTNSFSAPSRLWRLRFNNPEKPELGGNISAVLNGTEGQKMLDNMVIDNYGHILLQEDVGNNVHNGKIWQYTIATDELKLLAQHDSTRFIAGGANYLSQDEEASGIIDMQNILGPGMFILADQAHYPIVGEAVEGGQLLSLFNPDTYQSSLQAGPSSSQTPYLIPVAAGVTVKSILSTTDNIRGYKMAGIPDGLGAFDNGNGTFTLLMNHELSSGLGSVRAHGSNGAFVSKWIINTTDLGVISGADLIKNVKLWNGSGYNTYNAANPSPLASFSRFCSADLPATTAFYDNGVGTQELLFLNGEENGTEGRAIAHIVTGANAGTSYELPWLGKMAWENVVASPYPSNKTVVAGMDDGSGGQVYIYVGSKTNSGTEVDKAGLTNGKLYGIAVSGLSTEAASVPSPNTAFSLVDMGAVQNISGDSLNKLSIAKGVTSFLRPEDGAWDPSNPRDFYFNTTNAFSAPSRVWRLRFTKPDQPELGGTITAVLDGTEGQKMLDNMAIDNYGHILLQEDVGNNAHIGKIWQYTIATDKLELIALHDSTRFINGAPNFLTQDEEASGIIDMQHILGPGMFLSTVQAHYAIAGEAVEGGQVLALFNPTSFNSTAEISVYGNNQEIPRGSTNPTASNNSDVGSTPLGSSINKSIVIRNTGPAVLKISSINVEGEAQYDFSVLGGVAFPLSIAGNSSREITLQFTPLASGVRPATMTINSNDFDEPDYRFALQGNGSYTRMVVKGNERLITNGTKNTRIDDNTNFGDVVVGTSKTLDYSIHNLGSSTLIISSLTLSGANASDFLAADLNIFPLVIDPGSSTHFSLKFTPGAIAKRTATISMSTNDPANPNYTFALQGNGISALPDISIWANNTAIADGDTLPQVADNTDFGEVSIGQEVTRGFSVRNKGTAPLHLQSFEMNGINAQEFRLTETQAFPLSIPVGGEQVLNIRFKPQLTGIRTAKVNISSNDPDIALYDFSIRGTGTIPLEVGEQFESLFAILHPNPAQDVALLSLRLENENLVRVEVFDVNGNVALPRCEYAVQQGQQTLRLHTAELSSGMYTIHLSSGTQQARIRMMVLH